LLNGANASHVPGLCHALLTRHLSGKTISHGRVSQDSWCQDLGRSGIWVGFTPVVETSDFMANGPTGGAFRTQSWLPPWVISWSKGGGRERILSGRDEHERIDRFGSQQLTAMAFITIRTCQYLTSGAANKALHSS
jgi:hypothetical protein